LIFPGDRLVVPIAILRHGEQSMSKNTTQVSSCTLNPAQAADAACQRSQSVPELEFFNNLGGTLEIELTVPAEPGARTYNLRASPEAQISNLRLHTRVFNRQTDGFRDLTPDELDSVAFRDNRITLRGLSGDVVAHDAANGEFFTVRELLHAVEDTERQTRDRSEWLGGVDTHHCYFEGIHLADDGVWDITWGS
jgi:hypothetical protein